MKKSLIATVTMLVIGTVTFSVQANMEGKMAAKAEFDKHCSACHPDGGNITNPSKPLNKSSLAKSGIKSWKDIVSKIRKPGPGMTSFDKKEISDKEAKAIAEYILKTFK